MKPANLVNQPSSWFGASGPACDIVISSRVRLARNLAGYEFLPCLAPERKQDILEKLREAILSLELGDSVFFVDVDHAAALERQLLMERHLISRQHAAGKGPRGAVIATGEAFTAMINEEDHLRMQVYAAGLNLFDCWQRINRIDDGIEQKVRYAFDAKLGYLTACPTNLGTGIRASVMLHLPALKLTGQIEKFAAAAKDSDLTVRGLFGEGTDAIGDFYQLSNQVTLGVHEEQVIKNMSENVVPRIVEYEKAARQSLMEERPSTLDDKIQRALGVLKSACLISSQESLYLLSSVRLGVNLGRIPNISLATINELFLQTQPAHLQIRAGKMLDPDQRDTLRAQVIRQKLCSN
jgi:protein arginine kinase